MNMNDVYNQHKGVQKFGSRKNDNQKLDPSFSNQSSVITKDVEIKQRHKRITDDFLKLTAELEADGLMEHDPLSHIFGVGKTLALFSVGLYVSYYYSEESVIYGVFGVVLLTLAGGPSLLFGQEATLLIGFIMGLSTSGWGRSHMEYHAMLNYGTERRRNHQIDLWFHFDRFWFLFWDSLIVTLSWKLNYHLEYVILNECWLELICMIAHYSLIPLLGFSVWFLVTWLSSILMVINLMLSHVQEPVKHIDSKQHWIENVFMRITNIRPFSFTNLWTAHLNYQIEHHLFPTMPYRNLILCSAKVKNFADKHNLPYKNCSFWEACKLAYFDPTKEIILL